VPEPTSEVVIVTETLVESQLLEAGLKVIEGLVRSIEIVSEIVKE
jgi:hypothetical protein